MSTSPAPANQGGTATPDRFIPGGPITHPAAIPSEAYGRAAVLSDENVRCWKCNRLLAELVSRPWRIKCSRCHAENQGAT